jgi:hypothetical protein
MAHRRPIRRIAEGESYSEWTVLKRGHRSGEWVCRCSCGAERAVSSTRLRRGRSRMCRECSKRVPRRPKRLVPTPDGMRGATEVARETGLTLTCITRRADQGLSPEEIVRPTRGKRKAKRARPPVAERVDVLMEPSGLDWPYYHKTRNERPSRAALVLYDYLKDGWVLHMNKRCHLVSPDLRRRVKVNAALAGEFFRWHWMPPSLDDDWPFTVSHADMPEDAVRLFEDAPRP